MTELGIGPQKLWQGRASRIPSSGGCRQVSWECLGNPALAVGCVERYQAAGQQRGSGEK